MNGIREAVYGLLVLSLSAGLLIDFQGGKSKTAPYIRYLLSLILLLMLLSPLVTVISALQNLRGLGFSALGDANGASFTESPNLYEQTAINYAKREAADDLRLYLTRKTGIPGEAMEIDFTVDLTETDSAVITAVEITVLSQRYRILSEKLALLTQDLLLCPCTVVINDEGGA